MKKLQNLFLCAAGLVPGLLGACSTNAEGPRRFTVSAGEYEQAFEATREALTDLDFELDRVDAASGVITTAPHFSQGLLQPWDHTQSSLADEWEDAMNMQAREVRVTFTPAADDAGSSDLRAAPSELTAEVRVTVYREQRPGRRLDSEWVGGSTFYVDRDLVSRTTSKYLVALRRDEQLEARVARAVTERMAAAPAPGSAVPAASQSGSPTGAPTGSD